MKKIFVRLKERSYPILIGDGLLGTCGRELNRLGAGRDAFVITNKFLLTLYGKLLRRGLEKGGIKARFEIVPDSEKAKSIKEAARLVESISRFDVRKDLMIIAFGGGVVGDISGFTAATYKRGVPYAQVPTTLLAQVDSAIGGKTAVDLPIAKNMVGAFYQPRAVISDTSLLNTLPVNQLRSGMAEVIKYGVIKDAGLFSFLEKNCGNILGRDARSLELIVSRSSAIKASLVAKDEFDKKSIRAVLNFGHTFGHAIEAASKYSGYSHGEAVSIGMVIASNIACRLGIMSVKNASRIEGLIKKFGLPTRIGKHLKFSDIRESYRHDKKFANKTNRLILPIRIGEAKVAEDLPDPLIKKVLKESFL